MICPVTESHVSVSFFVPGKPMGKGDHAGIRDGAGNLVGIRERDAGRKQKWRDFAADCARIALGERPIFDEAIRVAMVYFLEHPKKHLCTGKNAGYVCLDAPPYPITKRRDDIDKIQRSVGDALIGVLWTDDAIITSWHACRRWGARVGLLITVEPEHD